ncbi:MAG: hypothetical protein QOG62_128 [Thermoleophilaceae bacterium]|nr:hypothetical protein [Thermoleophilaceae bacterium]
MALPVALAMVTLLLLLGSVVTIQTVTAMSGTNRDARVKLAIQAANAGLETAQWRTNTLSEAVNNPLTTLNCALRGVSGTISLVGPVNIQGVPWCPASSPESLGNGESYSYQISGLAGIDFDNLSSTLDREVVATGTANGITRRVLGRYTAIDMARLFTDFAVFSKETLTISNNTDVGSSEIHGNARSNSDIALSNNASISGNAMPGPGHTVTLDNNSSVNGTTTPATEPIVLPPATMPLSSDVDGICRTGLLNLQTCSSAIWNTTTRRLSLSGQNVTMIGNVFSLCSLVLTNNSTLTFTPANVLAPMRVYIDSPSNCLVSGSPPAASLSASNNWRIQVGLTALTYPIVQMYVVGAATPTTISLDNNSSSSSPIALYAPNSNVTLSNNASFRGGIAANRLTLSNHADITPAGVQIGSLIGLLSPIYTLTRYSECSTTVPGPSQSPDAGC